MMYEFQEFSMPKEIWEIIQIILKKKDDDIFKYECEETETDKIVEERQEYLQDNQTEEELRLEVQDQMVEAIISEDEKNFIVERNEVDGNTVLQQLMKIKQQILSILWQSIPYLPISKSDLFLFP